MIEPVISCAGAFAKNYSQGPVELILLLWAPETCAISGGASVPASRALSLLVWVPESCADSTIFRSLQNALHTSATTLPELMQAYRSLWSRHR